jgi:hypothetical protein
MNLEHVQLVVAALNAGAYYTVGETDQHWCLAEREGAWQIYFLDRGVPSGARRYSSLDAACRSFLRRMVEDTDVAPG